MENPQKESGRQVTKEEKSIDKFGAQMLVEHIDAFARNLSAWELRFISSLIDNPPNEYSDTVKDIIQRIYDEKC